MPKKATIPKAIREQLWIETFGKVYEHKCYVHWCKNIINVWDTESISALINVGKKQYDEFQWLVLGTRKGRVKRIKIDEHDENLDFCVTPNRIFSF